MLRFGQLIYSNAKLLLLAGLLLITPMAVAAEITDVNFLVVKNQGIYKKITDFAQQSLSDRGSKINVNVIETNHQNLASGLPDGELITIGTQAAAYAYQHYPGVATISALLTRSSFEKLASNYYGGVDKARQKGVWPLILDQPLGRFFRLGAKLVPSAETVGVLVGPANEQRLPEIIAAANSVGLETNISLLKPDDNPVQVIEPVMRESDFFVVLPDRKLINQMAAKWALPLSYRYRLPLIAYSQKYVDAGALASVFYSPEDIANTIVEAMLASTSATPEGCSVPTVSVNRSVARSLGVDVLSPGQYLAELTECEAQPP